MPAILGVLLAGIIMMLSLPSFVNASRNSQDNITYANTAEHQTRFNQAVSDYVKQNSAAIKAAATATSPAAITVAMLKAPGIELLPSGFNEVNPYGQTWRAEVLETTAGNLQVLAYSVGGTALTDGKLIKIANLVKPSGGFIPGNDSGLFAGGAATARGAFAKWTVSTANYSSISGGHLATLMTFTDGQLGSNYLYRNLIPGQPQLNQMNTPLIMAATQTKGSSCTTTGAIAQDGAGVLLSCQSGTWQEQGSAYWKDPVASFASLPTCNSSTAWQTRIIQTPSVGTGPRAYTCTGSAWSALAVDNSGNLTANGTVTLGKIQVNDVVTEGAACSSNGLVARNSVGLLLSCQSGSWQKASGSGGGLFGGPGGYIKATSVSGPCPTSNPATGACTCPSGSSAKKLSEWNASLLTYSAYACY